MVRGTIKMSPILQIIRLKNLEKNDPEMIRKIGGWHYALIYYSTSTNCINFDLLSIWLQKQLS